MATLNYLEVIQTSSEDIGSALISDPDSDVLFCPGWTVRDLARHVGSAHGWAAAVLTSGQRTDPPDLPRDVPLEELSLWCHKQTELLLATLETVDPDADAWTFGPPRNASFWMRRMALETSAHAFDVGGQFASRPQEAERLAVDGVSEFLEVFLPRIVKRNPTPWRGQTLHLHQDGGDGEWFVTIGGLEEEPVTVELVHRRADLALRSKALNLYLWMLNRVPTDQLVSFGDLSLAELWSREVTF